MRILVADDERDLNDAIVRRLTDAGYSVDGCYDGESVFGYLAGADYDAVILDVMMPGADGFHVLERMRSEGKNIPVIMLSARDSTDDKVFGLDRGANDYLAKPFEFKELEARLRNVLRKPSGNATNVFTVADLTVDVQARVARRAGREIRLSAKEFAILECMIRNAGIVMSRERIENAVWNYDYSGGTNVIDVYIRYLRKKIDEGCDRKLIHTVRGVGYVIR
jgi:DNA-binding response OmpR family regulator